MDIKEQNNGWFDIMNKGRQSPLRNVKPVTNNHHNKTGSCRLDSERRNCCCWPAVWGGCRFPATEQWYVKGCWSIWSWPTPDTGCASKGWFDPWLQEALRSPCPQTGAAGASGRCRCPSLPPRLAGEEEICHKEKLQLDACYTLDSYVKWITCKNVLLHVCKSRVVTALHSIQQQCHLIHLGGL